jgi:cytochrome c-type biogenesis protein
MMAGERGRWLLGGVLIAVGLAVATGWDRDAETWLLDHSPDWLTRLTTRY